MLGRDGRASAWGGLGFFAPNGVLGIHPQVLGCVKEGKEHAGGGERWGELGIRSSSCGLGPRDFSKCNTGNRLILAAGQSQAGKTHLCLDLRQTAQWRHGKRRRGGVQGMCGWEGVERPGFQWCSGARSSPPHQCRNRAAHWAARSTDCFWSRLLFMLYPGRGFGVCCLLMLAQELHQTSLSQSPAAPLDPALGTHTAWGLFRQGCVNSPSCGCAM